jgi:branched-chain amino acid transport system substrate-binding protein
MKTKIAVFMILLLLLFGCSQSSKETIKIGVILPLSGNQATYGQGISEGLNLALEELNNLDIPKIELIYEDNGGEVKNTVTAAQKLISVDNVVAIITGVSQHSLAVASIVEQNKIVLYTMASHASKLNTAGDYVFKNDDDFAKAGETQAEFIFNLGHRKVGIIYATYNDATIDAKEAFQRKFESMKGEVISEGFGKDETDFKVYLTKLNSKNPSVIYVNGLAKDNALILKQIGEFGLKQQIFGSSGMEDPQVINNAGKMAEGVIFATFNVVPPETFVKKIEAKYSHKPLRWTIEAYDGLNIIASAISNIKDEVTSEKLKDELSKIKSYNGEGGETKFDDQGNAKKQLLIKTIRNGKFELYEN